MKRLLSWLHHLLLIPVLVLLVVVSMLRLGLHSHPAYHQQVEDWLQQALQQSVAIDDFTLYLQGRNLAIDIVGAELGSNSLDLERLSFSLDLPSLLLDQQLVLSKVQLFGLAVSLQEQADGSWQPQGLVASQSATPTSNETPSVFALMALLHQAGSFALTDAHITLAPKFGKTLTINNVAALVRPFGDNGVAVNLHANYPETQGKLAALARIRFTEEMAVAEAQAKLQLQKLPLQPLWQQLQVADVQSGQVSATAWVKVEEQQLKSIRVRGLELQTNYQELAIDWQSDFDLLRNNEQWQLQVTNVAGLVGGQNWPVGDLALVADQEQLQLAIPILQLQPIAGILKQLPSIPTKVTAPIIALAPQGRAVQARITWQKANPKDFLFTAGMDNAAISSWKGIPEVSGASGQIAINAKGGKVSIDDHDGISVHMHNLTSQAWPFDSMQGEVAWGINKQVTHLFSSLVQLTQGDSQLNLFMDGDFPRKGVEGEPFMHLRLGLQNMDVASIPAMLPNVSMGTSLGDYLANAAKAGRIAQGGVTFNGMVGKQAKDLGPYSYSVAVWGQAQLPKVHYAAGWPEIYKADLDFSSNHQMVTVDLHDGQLLGNGKAGFDLVDWQVKVPMLSTQDKSKAMIEVSGDLQGDGTLYQRIAKQMPASVVVPSWIMELNPTGQIKLQVNVAVPYGPQAKGRSPQYDLQVTGNKIAGFWQAQQVALSKVNLSTRVTQQGVQSLTLNGKADGHTFSLEQTSAPRQKDWQPQLLRKVWQQYSVAERPGDWLRLQGQVPRTYAMQKLGLQDLNLDDWLPTQPQVDMQLPVCFLSSDSCQLAFGQIRFSPAEVNWPNIIAATSEAYWLWQREGEEQSLYVNAGEQHLALAIEQGKLQGVGIGLGETAPMVSSGTHIKGAMPELDAPYWMAYMQSDKDASGLGIPDLKHLDIQAERLLWQELQLNKAVLTYDAIDDGWALGILADEITGHVFNAGEGSPWLVDIDSIHIQLPEEEELAEGEEKQDLLAAIDPSIFPDMDIELHDITKNEQSYGHWKLKARNSDGKVYLHDIEAEMHNSKLSGNMIWGKQGAAHETAFSGRILSHGVAETLSGWGYSPTIDSEYGALEVQLTWPASPLAFDIEKSTGDLALRVKQGEFSQSPGATSSLKVLSLLDVSRLLQRVRLDFTDVLSDEYQFDSINAHYKISGGVARTAVPATFKSSSLELNLGGYIDFNDRTVDHDLYVTLPVTDKLPFAALLAGLPQLSGVLYVVDKLVGDELSTFTSARYSITGDLDKPDMTLQQMFDANNAPKSLDERVNNVFKFQ